MSLWKLRQALLSRKGPQTDNYRVPKVWSGGLTGFDTVNPYTYYSKVVDEVLSRPAQNVEKKKGWTKEAHIYNLFVRSACSFDHNGDGTLGGNDKDATCNKDGVRETGTFLKALALLPHIQRLGCDTVYLLPITTIGKANRKGLLGSPYAIKNPYKLDEHLADPLVPELDVDTQFAAFTEAAHHLGLRVVLEFVFRTSAQDGDWVKEHPEWYYWIDKEIPDRSEKHPEGYGNPPFTAEQMKKIKDAGEEPGSGLVRTPAQVKEALDRGEGELIEPPADYQKMYLGVPEKVELDEHNYWVGTMADGKKARIPGAFADWPPDDVQPPWTDVTYLRMFGKPNEDYDYMAYNTIRLYDPNLATEEKANKELWDHVASVVPSYQERFGIDGIMIDMGHALPVDLAFDIQKRARDNDEGFAFWEEKFFLDPISPQTGYEAVVGPGIFTLGDPQSAAQYFKDFGEPPTRFFATGENHNTPRLAARGGIPWTKQAWALALFLPGAVPFVHNGIEVLDKVPLNTGLCFSKEDLAALEGTPLGLFDAACFNWEDGGADMIPFIATTFAIHRKHSTLLTSMKGDTYNVAHSLPEKVIGYYRLQDGSAKLGVFANTGSDDVALHIGKKGTDLITGVSFDGTLTLAPEQVCVVELS